MLIEFHTDICSRNILYLRKKYSVSRRALARLTGISEYTLQRYENGAFPQIYTDCQLKRLCAVFGLPLDALTQEYLAHPQK